MFRKKKRKRTLKKLILIKIWLTRRKEMVIEKTEENNLLRVNS